MTTSLIAEFTVLSGHEEQVKALVSELTEQVRAEPGNVLFLPHVLPENPRHYLVFESYVDDEAFATHLEQEHGRVFNAAIETLVVGGASKLTHLASIEVTSERVG